MNNQQVIPLLTDSQRHTDNDLKVITCKTCGDVGSIYTYRAYDGPFAAPTERGDKWLDLPDGAGWYHGKLEAEPCPDCRSYQKKRWLVRKTLLETEDQGIRLADFSTTGKLHKKEQIKQVFTKLAGMGVHTHGFITLWGDPGVGKTMLCKALVNELVLQGHEATFISMGNLLDDIRSNFDEQVNRMTAVENAIQRWSTIPALMIDEFDKAKYTDFAKDTITKLLDYRYNKRDYGLLTVLTMNMQFDDMPLDLAYIRSRMSAGIVLEVPGPDVRSALGMKARAEMGLG